MPDDYICAKLTYAKLGFFGEPLIGREIAWLHAEATTGRSSTNGKQVGSRSMVYVPFWRNPRVKARGPAMRAVFAAAALLQFAPSAHAGESTLDDFPFLVHCEMGDRDRVFYLSTIGQDGVAIYISPDRQAGTISVKGKAEPVGVEGAGNCAGKTLQQLRTTGQAYYLQR